MVQKPCTRKTRRKQQLRKNITKLNLELLKKAKNQIKFRNTERFNKLNVNKIIKSTENEPNKGIKENTKWKTRNQHREEWKMN